MNMNNVERFRELDPQGMIDHINALPDQLAGAYQLGLSLDLPKWDGIQQVLVAGMGGSAIGGDLLAEYARPLASAPVIVHRDYGLPTWAKDEGTLLICSSHSGNTEETLSVFAEAAKANCRILAVTTGGKLAEQAKEAGAALWIFEDDFQPRAAVGFSFGLLLAALFRLGLIPDPQADLAGAVAAMKAQQENLLPEVPDTANPAKRMGGQFMGRWVTIFGSGYMRPIARRWKCQINELSKAQATFEELPEADHNTLQGVIQPQGQFDYTMSIWLRGPHNHPRNLLRDEFTRTGMMVQGINTDFVMGTGDSPLAEMWTALHYGDYASYYLAMAYEVDPTPVPMLIELKGKMKAA